MPKDHPDPEDGVIYLLRRVYCPECNKYRAMEAYYCNPSYPGELALTCKCDDPRTDDEVMGEFLDAIKEAGHEDVPYMDERMN